MVIGQTLAASPPISDPAVAAAFDAFPAPERVGLLALRQAIFDTAAATPGVGPLTETLKWGQPAYLTAHSRSGSTVRLGLPRTGGFAIYVNCQTTILSNFRRWYPDEFTCEGDRAIQFAVADDLPLDKIGHLIALALTYHQKAPR